MRRLILTSILMLACASGAEQSSTDLLAMSSGAVWVYEGSVSWTLVNSNVVRSQNIRWEMKALNKFVVEDGVATLFEGFPHQLAWYEPGRKPTEDLVVAVEGRYYIVSTNRIENVLQELETGKVKSLRPLVKEDEIWFVEPLRLKQQFCEPDQAERQEAGGYTGYCWYVSKISDVSLDSTKGVPLGRRTQYELLYRTLPDHQIFRIVPGVGITGYDFSHHGTVAEAHVRLIEFRPGVSTHQMNSAIN